MATRKTKDKTAERLQAPNTVNGTVPPKRVANGRRPPREYLTVKEVELLMSTARGRGRYGHRDATMILTAYRHGLRAGELCALRRDQVELEHGLLHVRRIKNGMPSVHPIGGEETRALRRLMREQPQSRYVFVTERLATMAPAGFRKMLARVGEAAKFPFPGSAGRHCRCIDGRTCRR
jgi:integrase